MKLSLTLSENAPLEAPFVFREGYQDAIRKAAQIGYDGVELHIRNPQEVNVEQILQSCQENSMKVSTIGTGLGYGMDHLCLSSNEKKIREKAINRIESHVQLAKQLDCAVIIGLMKGQKKDSGGSYESFEKYSIESLKKCIEIAEKESVLLVLEAINRYESDVLNTIEATAEFIERFDSNFLKMHIDTYHMNIEESDIVKPIIEAKHLIGHVHLADNNRLYPGQGMFDFHSLIEVLKMINYDGFLAMECMALPTSDEAATGALSYMEQVLRGDEVKGGNR